MCLHGRYPTAGRTCTSGVKISSMSQREPVVLAIALAPFLYATTSRAQTPGVPPDTSIRLERTACFGECPVYVVTIDARGNVTFEGRHFVRVEGKATDTIPVARVAE